MAPSTRQVSRITLALSNPTLPAILCPPTLAVALFLISCGAPPPATSCAVPSAAACATARAVACSGSLARFCPPSHYLTQALTRAVQWLVFADDNQVTLRQYLAAASTATVKGIAVGPADPFAGLKPKATEAAIEQRGVFLSEVLRQIALGLADLHAADQVWQRANCLRLP